MTASITKLQYLLLAPKSPLKVIRKFLTGLIALKKVPCKTCHHYWSHNASMAEPFIRWLLFMCLIRKHKFLKFLPELNPLTDRCRCSSAAFAKLKHKLYSPAWWAWSDVHVCWCSGPSSWSSLAVSSSVLLAGHSVGAPSSKARAGTPAACPYCAACRSTGSVPSSRSRSQRRFRRGWEWGRPT